MKRMTKLMRKILLMAVVPLALLSVAAIKFYTDYPNSVPIGSDFFSLQRNQSYINASVSQVKSDWFNNPVFTGSGGIQGNWRVDSFMSVGGYLAISGVYYGDGTGLSNLLTSATNTYINNFTNNTFITTNTAFIQTNINNTSIITNVSLVNNQYVTNLTVVVPGGLTNLNATPKTLAWWDLNDAIASIPNGNGLLTNSSGDIGWSLSVAFDDLNVTDAYLTNVFTFLTNAAYLATDANGMIVAGTGTISNNTTIVNNFSANYITNNTFYGTNLYATTIYGATNFSTNLYYVTGKGNTLIITNVSIAGVQTNLNIAASSLVSTKADQVLTNANVGNFLSFSGNTLSASGSSANLATALTDETGAGLVVFSGSPTETNTTIKGNVQGTNALSVTVNRVDITNNLGGFTQTGVNNTNTGTVGAGGGFIGNITGNLTGDISAGTNLIYRYTTNIVGAANFVFGKAYWTNITANFTFPALTMQDNAAMETLSVWVTNSGASTFTATINGVAGAPGHVVPAVFYCTNATVTEIDLSHFGVLWTNACVGKN
jgi:hypothetical protein